MNANLSLSSITRPVSAALAHYHATIYVVVTAVLLSAAIGMLYLLIDDKGTPDDATLTEARISDSFDNATAERVNELRDSNEALKPIVFPSPRSNPFVE